MSILVAIAIALAAILLLFGLTSGLRRWLSEDFTVRISDETTQVLDSDGNCVIEVPTTVRYVSREGTARVVAFGENSVGITGEDDSMELALSSPPTGAPVELRDAWGAYITYCCEKARRARGIGQWRPLRVAVTAETSDAEANQHFLSQASHKSLRWIGSVGPARSA